MKTQRMPRSRLLVSSDSGSRDVPEDAYMLARVGPLNLEDLRNTSIFIIVLVLSAAVLVLVIEYDTIAATQLSSFPEMAIPLRSSQCSLAAECVRVQKRSFCGVCHLAVVEHDYEPDYEHDPEIIVLSKCVNQQKGCFSMWRNRTQKPSLSSHHPRASLLPNRHGP